jgi:hypothetical protein
MMNGNFLNLAQTIREKHKRNAEISSSINFINIKNEYPLLPHF